MNPIHPFTVTVLGSGTSQGVPVIGCTCPVCRSEDPKDKRLRSSILISAGATQVAIDIGPDFRQQMLRAQVQHLSAILLTHEHNDHIIGLDDVRPFNFQTRQDMPVYGTENVLKEVRHRFHYIFEGEKYPGAPMVRLYPIEKNQPFEVGGLSFTPIEVDHGRVMVLGFRLGDFTYITDMKRIAEAEKEKVKGTHTLIVNALHQEGHRGHMSLDEALGFIEEIQPQKAYITHISHRMGLHQEVNRQLPDHVQLAHDGLKLQVAVAAPSGSAE
jgi:phosphoribosyl 1,2-cyclic phosphate phosphodiesterase